jgi:hypothetical protein
MDDTMAPLPADAPEMVAWRKFEAGEAYVNSMRWALDTDAPGDRRQRYVEVALWVAFLQGWEARGAVELPGQDDET